MASVSTTVDEMEDTCRPLANLQPSENDVSLQSTSQDEVTESSCGSLYDQRSNNATGDTFVNSVVLGHEKEDVVNKPTIESYSNSAIDETLIGVACEETIETERFIPCEHTDEQTTETPELTAESPEQTTESPEQAAETPEKAAESPEQAAETPEQAAETPEQTTETPKQTAESPEQRPNVEDSQYVESPDVNLGDSPYTESPDVGSQEDEPYGASAQDGTDSVGDERISNIEDEYIQRIANLEERHFELEDVLTRLMSAIEIGLAESGARQLPSRADDVEVDGGDLDEPDAVPFMHPQSEHEGRSRDGREFARRISLELFVEFQLKMRQFGTDLNGVLNCSEAAIRHARVVQEWATSVQIMFEQIKEERQKILDYIDEREKNMLTVKEQFIEELQGQGRQLQYLVDDMMSHREMRERSEEYCRSKYQGADDARPVEESMIDVIMRRRFDEERSIILSLSKQSKISEMKLFIIHQQNCIQQLQEQNRELKAIIEGLMGPDDLEDEDTDPTGTPSAGATPDRFPVPDLLEHHDDNAPLSLVSDVLHCDRGEFLPGTSTDGDIATLQTYNIGGSRVAAGENVVFDPLTVDYVRKQCLQAEETERRIHESENIRALYEYSDEESGTDAEVLQDDSDIEVLQEPEVDANEDPDVEVLQDGLEQLTFELKKEPVEQDNDVYDGAGDRVDLPTEKTQHKYPPTSDDGNMTTQNPPSDQIVDAPTAVCTQ